MDRGLDGLWVVVSIDFEYAIRFKKIVISGDEFDGLIPRANGSCIFRNNEPNVASFYNDLEIREDIVEFPAGSTIVSR
jgi:hypothetical protein